MEDAEEGKPFLPNEYTTPEVVPDARSLKRQLLDWVWVISTVIFASLSFFLYIRSTRIATYEHGFSTDLDALKSQIQLHQVQFTGGLELNETGKLHRIIATGQPQYVGPPTPEIDAAWDELMLALDLDLPVKESEDVRWTMKGEENDKYRVSLDLYHSLHCLCSADLTPLGYEWNEEYQVPFPLFKEKHTCRNFEKIKSWAMERIPPERKAHSHSHSHPTAQRQD
ncbi:uncharacterized protein N7496_000326 [Penicillium cataractarum]|uniref:Uncharacterized protein n=1 Tax=Penicillium cataractarum TaxID=2100454 RepID=A0A9W9VU04_9EURO|nr:uncharacterized protein N7496_000326 [Penicillium cataractarum]KAJ5389258.1 hypothetical protein N7496_000326 [Penicillium cataractarum]